MLPVSTDNFCLLREREREGKHASIYTYTQWEKKIEKERVKKKNHDERVCIYIHEYPLKDKRIKEREKETLWNRKENMAGAQEREKRYNKRECRGL